MYNHRQRIIPALGKAAEVRAHLTEWVKHLQGQGRNIALTTRIFSSDGPLLTVNTRAEDLATFERYRQESMTDSDWQSRAAKLMGLLASPVHSVLSETLSAPPPGGAVGIVQRAICLPAVGKDRQVRSILDEFVQDGQKAGVRVGLGRQIYSSTGPAFILTSLYPDLAALDKTRQERAKITGDAAQAVSELSRAPIQVRLFEVLVTYPR
jgi:hypothetical protein